jgi:DNA-binding MarR family transcriptional regulator
MADSDHAEPTPTPIPGSTPAVEHTLAGLRALILAGEQFRHAVADRFGVAVSDAVAMSYLAIDGSMSPGELASRVGLTPSTVTSLLDRLEQAGLAIREAHASDRRKIAVSISAGGLAMLLEVRSWMLRAVGVLDADRLATLGADLTDLAASLTVQTAGLRGSIPAPPV